MKTVIGVDIGTTHIKSILFDEYGWVLKEEKCRTPLNTIENKSVYSPDEVSTIVKMQILGLCEVCIEKPLGISITGMAEAGLIVDKNSGMASTDILPWFDNRTCAIAETMTLQEEEYAFQTTGLRNSFKYGIYKFLWLLKENHLDKKDSIWLSVCDYIAYCLTGELVTDATFAARTYVYHVLKGNWDENRIRSYGLELANFPKVVPSGESFGSYNGIHVAIAGHDHICAAFGLLYENKQGVCDSAGTSETYIGRVSKLDAIKQIGFSKDSGLLYGPYVDSGYFYMANVPSSGHSVEWFRKKLQMQELSYEDMNYKLLECSNKPTEILFLPYLTGMGAPWYKADKTGAILGLRENHKGIDILKGILEGLQYQAKWLLTIIQKYHSGDIETVYCAGGAVQNEAMMQLKADILNRTVEIPSVTEATLSGAAALFLQKNLSRECAQMFLQKPLTIQKKYHPISDNKDAYDAIFNNQFLPMAKLLN